MPQRDFLANAGRIGVFVRLALEAERVSFL